MHEQGEAPASDAETALRYFDLAIEAGNADATFELAVTRRDSEVIPEDFALARRLLTEVGTYKDGLAMGNLAVMMELGEAGPVDIDGALATYGAAMALGHVESAFWAAWMIADNPDHFADPVLGDAYCVWAIKRSTPEKVAEWEPDCVTWFGGLSAEQHAAARRLSATL